MTTRIFSFVTILSLGISISIPAQTNRFLVVKADQPKADIQPAMWGVFFEDINFAADGGIYAELVKNRSFEFKSPLTGWKEIKQGDAKGRLLIINRENEKPANPRVLNIKADAMKGDFGISNEGFRGMGIKKDNQYNFSILACSIEGNVKLKVELISASGQKIGEASLENFTSDWGKYSVSFKASATDPKASLNVLFAGKG